MPYENYYNEYEENQYAEGQIPRKSNIDDQFANDAKEYGKNDPKYDSKATKVSTDNNYLFHKTGKKFTSLDELQTYQKEEMREEINDKVYKPDKDSFNDDPKVVDSKLDSVPVKKYTYNIPKLFAGPSRTIPVSIDDIISGDRDSRNARLSWLFDQTGLVYRFDRGMVLINQDGLKDDDEVDPTDIYDHHFNSIERLARRTFGIQLVTTDTIARCVEATEQGLVAMMCEGAKCYIFLPDEITEAQIDQIISEVEPRDFTFTLAKDADRFSDPLTREEVLAYFGSLKREFRVNNPDNAEEEVLSDREAYINALLIYIYQNGMSLNQYFTMLGEKLRSGDVTGLPDFERINPFLNPDDIRRLYDSKEDRIVEHFARTMTGVIALNLGELGQLQENKEEKEPEKEPEKDSKDRNGEVVARETRDEYIRLLINYIKGNKISLEEYYRALATNLRNRDNNSIPEFEAINPFLNEDDIRRLLTSEDERIIDYFAHTMAGVIELNLDEMDRVKDDEDKEKIKDNKDVKESPRKDREEYIRLLLNYIKGNKISLEEYYRALATNLRNRENNSIPEFEAINPFLNEDDIRRLLTSEDERIIDYFAHTMARVIELNIEQINTLNNTKEPHNRTNNFENNNENNKEDSIKNGISFRGIKPNPPHNPESDPIDLDEMSYLDEETNYMSGIRISYVNTDLINHMSGFAVIREKKTGRINIYGYENDDINLSGKKVIENSTSKIESGYYVNLNEYIGILEHGMEEQYGSNANFSFVNERGEYLNFYEVINNIMNTCRREGALRFGKEYKESPINNYEDLEKQYTGVRSNFRGIELTKGLYVRRDILIDELNKYRIAVIKENIDNASHVR